VKGLFTHRTIQFSMSSGFRHRSVSTQKSVLRPPSPSHSGDKKPQRRIHCLFSATESSRLRGGEITAASESVKNYFQLSCRLWFRLRGEPLSKERGGIYASAARCQKLFSLPSIFPSNNRKVFLSLRSKSGQPPFVNLVRLRCD
jgi:hypothetical protein